MQSELGIKVSKATAGKIGLFGAMSVIIGGVIGIGIFFKNNGVFKNNNGNATGILLSWIIAIVIGIATAYSYGEIVSVKDKSANSGLGGWSNKFGGNWLGRTVKITQPFIYYSLYVVVGGVFAAEAIMNCFMRSGNALDSSVSMWMIMLIALGVIILFMTTNAFVGKANKKFSEITSPIKFIPLLLVISLGVIFGVMHSQHDLFMNPGDVYSNETTPTQYSGTFDINGVFMSLPPILFALDSFLVVGNIASDVKHPEKNIPLSILLSMILSGAVYLFVTIGQICTGCGNAYNLIDFIFTNGNGGTIASNLKVYATICDAVISIFILIAILGVVNSLSMGCVSAADTSINEGIIIGSDRLIKFCKGRQRLPGFISAGITTLFYWGALGIPSMLMNTDQFMDGASNLIVIFFFAIYGLVALYSAVNRKTHKVKDITKSKGQVPMALIGGCGCILVALYGIFYTYFANVIMNSQVPNTSWGLFLQNSSILNQWQSAVTFWSFAIFFIAVPIINDLLIRHFKPHSLQRLIWEKWR